MENLHWFMNFLQLYTPSFKMLILFVLKSPHNPLLIFLPLFPPIPTTLYYEKEQVSCSTSNNSWPLLCISVKILDPSWLYPCPQYRWLFFLSFLQWHLTFVSDQRASKVLPLTQQQTALFLPLFKYQLGYSLGRGCEGFLLRCLKIILNIFLYIIFQLSF